MADKRPPAKVLRGLSEADLLAQLETLRQELWRCRTQSPEGTQPKTAQVPALKRQIARVHTVLRERRGGGQP